jgi:hypothetical protein
MLVAVVAQAHQVEVLEEQAVVVQEAQELLQQELKILVVVVGLVFDLEQQAAQAL